MDKLEYLYPKTEKIFELLKITEVSLDKYIYLIKNIYLVGFYKDEDRYIALLYNAYIKKYIMYYTSTSSDNI